jgi:hypothetical protein
MLCYTRLEQQAPLVHGALDWPNAAAHCQSRTPQATAHSQRRGQRPAASGQRPAPNAKRQAHSSPLVLAAAVKPEPAQTPPAVCCHRCTGTTLLPCFAVRPRAPLLMLTAGRWRP